MNFMSMILDMKWNLVILKSIDFSQPLIFTHLHTDGKERRLNRVAFLVAKPNRVEFLVARSRQTTTPDAGAPGLNLQPAASSAAAAAVWARPN